MVDAVLACGALLVFDAQAAAALVLLANNAVLQAVKGQSLGKMIAGIYMIEEVPFGHMRARCPMTYWRVGLRAVIRYIEITLWPMALLWWFISPTKQLPGDFFSRALVINCEDLDKVPVLRQVA